MSKRLAKSKPTWADVKTNLTRFDRAALLRVLQDLYAGDEGNRAFLHARFGLDEDPLQAYKKLVDRWLWSDIFRGQQTSVSRAKRAITKYKKALGDPAGLAELMVFNASCADVYNADPAYFDALVRTFAQALRIVAELPTNVQTSLLSRLDRVRTVGRQLGYGIGEDMDVLLAEFDSSFQAREVLHGNRNR